MRCCRKSAYLTHPYPMHRAACSRSAPVICHPPTPLTISTFVQVNQVNLDLRWRLQGGWVRRNTAHSITPQSTHPLPRHYTHTKREERDGERGERRAPSPPLSLHPPLSLSFSLRRAREGAAAATPERERGGEGAAAATALPSPRPLPSPTPRHLRTALAVAWRSVAHVTDSSVTPHLPTACPSPPHLPTPSTYSVP